MLVIKTWILQVNTHQWQTSYIYLDKVEQRLDGRQGRLYFVGFTSVTCYEISPGIMKTFESVDNITKCTRNNDSYIPESSLRIFSLRPQIIRPYKKKSSLLKILP